MQPILSRHAVYAITVIKETIPPRTALNPAHVNSCKPQNFAIP